MKKELIALSLLVTAASLGAYQTSKAQMRVDSGSAVYHPVREKPVIDGGEVERVVRSATSSQKSLSPG